VTAAPNARVAIEALDFFTAKLAEITGMPTTAPRRERVAANGLIYCRLTCIE
jgi:hypothetical protein